MINDRKTIFFIVSFFVVVVLALFISERETSLKVRKMYFGRMDFLFSLSLCRRRRRRGMKKKKRENCNYNGHHRRRHIVLDYI